MRLIVTRPEPEAARWVVQFGDLGVEAVALPLIEIAATADWRPVAQAWQRLERYAAIMFVSAAAVRHFFGAAPPAGSTAWRAAAWATGPGTAQALYAHGVPAARIVQPPAEGGQFDSEALWRLVQPALHSGQEVLIVRGAAADGVPAGRDWLAERLAEAGVVVETVGAYRRLRPSWTAAQLALAHAAAVDGSAWLFSSSEAVGNLRALLPGTSWRAARAIATHARIAQTSREAGFGVVCLSRPAVEAVAAALESFR